MIPFLQSVAVELTARYGPSLKEFLIVLPHKRGALFMRRYFEQALSDRLLHQPHSREMPRIETITDHVGRISGLRKASRLQLLFALYDAHRALYAKGQPPTAEDFEQFRRRGETLVSDFNDVDMYCVDADALFKNLGDYNDIRTDYLNEEQRRVIEQYLGVTEPVAEVERFWKNVRSEREVQHRFLSLWEKLAPLYHTYCRSLADKGLSYPGLAFKAACERLHAGKFKFDVKRVVYVGFNALSTVERRLFGIVKGFTAPDGHSLADFFWDTPGPALAEGSPVQAGRFLRRNAKDFPCSVPEMDQYADARTFPDKVLEIACPGNTAQAKVISSLLDDIIRGQGQPYLNPARVAVVLPDEGLLFPVLHSVPADVASKVNLTMGYPLRLTSVASFVDLVRRLHTRSRKSGGRTRMFGKDVSALLSHPLTRSLLGRQAANLMQGYIIDSHLYFVTLDDMLAALPAQAGQPAGERARLLFSPLPESDNPADATAHFADLLKAVRESLAQSDGQPAQTGAIETLHIERYLQAFDEFASLCGEYGLRMPPRTAVAMACRLLSNDTVSMQGEPLTGLQVMGMLETRALDFDYLIIPSMNERIFPRRLRARTFIPEALRLGYGIATTHFQEEIFAYHFYRLIARAKEVYLLYDASQGGLRSGDPSRYLLQLRYLLGAGRDIRRVSARFKMASDSRPRLTSVPKEGKTLAALARYITPGSGAVLSASAIKEYMACPLKFYFSYILNKKVDQEPQEFMDAIAIGNVLHESMQYIYDTLRPTPEHPAEITPAIIHSWLNAEAPIGEYASINEVAAHFIRKNYMPVAPADTPLPGDALLMLDMLVRQIRWSLEADLRLAPFEYLASELKLPATYPLRDKGTVNMVMIIDRLDRVCLSDAQTVLRIVDYKTGQDNTVFKKVSELFDPSGQHKAIFQLMLYAQLYAGHYAESDLTPIALSIYKSRELARSDFRTAVRFNGTPVLSHVPFMPEFRERLDALLAEMFDEDTPFAPGSGMPDMGDMSRKACRYCPYRSLCAN